MLGRRTLARGCRGPLANDKHGRRLSPSTRIGHVFLPAGNCDLNLSTCPGGAFENSPVRTQRRPCVHGARAGLFQLSLRDGNAQVNLCGTTRAKPSAYSCEGAFVDVASAVPRGGKSACRLERIADGPPVLHGPQHAGRRPVPLGHRLHATLRRGRPRQPRRGPSPLRRGLLPAAAETAGRRRRRLRAALLSLSARRGLDPLALGPLAVPGGAGRVVDARRPGVCRVCRDGLSRPGISVRCRAPYIHGRRRAMAHDDLAGFVDLDAFVDGVPRRAIDGRMADCPAGRTAAAPARAATVGRPGLFAAGDEAAVGASAGPLAGHASRRADLGGNARRRRRPNCW